MLRGGSRGRARNHDGWKSCVQCSADEARATLEHMDTLQPQPTNTEANIRKAAEAIAEGLQMKQEFIRCPRIQHS